MKNVKLPEQVRDLVLLLTLALVACVAFCGPDCDRDASKGKQGAMERRMDKARRGPQVGPEGPWWREDSKPERWQEGERKQRPQRNKKKGSAGDGEPVKVY